MKNGKLILAILTLSLLLFFSCAVEKYLVRDSYNTNFPGYSVSMRGDKLIISTERNNTDESDLPVLLGKDKKLMFSQNAYFVVIDESSPDTISLHYYYLDLKERFMRKTVKRPDKTIAIDCYAELKNDNKEVILLYGAEGAIYCISNENFSGRIIRKTGDTESIGEKICDGLKPDYIFIRIGDNEKEDFIEAFNSWKESFIKHISQDYDKNEWNYWEAEFVRARYFMFIKNLLYPEEKKSYDEGMEKFEKMKEDISKLNLSINEKSDEFDRDWDYNSDPAYLEWLSEINLNEEKKTIIRKTERILNGNIPAVNRLKQSNITMKYFSTFYDIYVGKYGNDPDINEKVTMILLDMSHKIRNILAGNYSTSKGELAEMERNISRKKQEIIEDSFYAIISNAGTVGDVKDINKKLTQNDSNNRFYYLDKITIQGKIIYDNIVLLIYQRDNKNFNNAFEIYDFQSMK